MTRMISQHARVRMQQRGVKRRVLDLLLQFGSSAHDHKGAEIVFMDGDARRRLRAVRGRDAERRFDKALDSYLVIGRGGQIVTVGRRYRRIRRKH